MALVCPNQQSFFKKGRESRAFYIGTCKINYMVTIEPSFYLHCYFTAYLRFGSPQSIVPDLHAVYLGRNPREQG